MSNFKEKNKMIILCLVELHYLFTWTLKEHKQKHLNVGAKKTKSPADF